MALPTCLLFQFIHLCQLYFYWQLMLVLQVIKLMEQALHLARMINVCILYCCWPLFVGIHILVCYNSVCLQKLTINCVFFILGTWSTLLRSIWRKTTFGTGCELSPTRRTRMSCATSRSTMKRRKMRMKTNKLSLLWTIRSVHFSE